MLNLSDRPSLVDLQDVTQEKSMSFAAQKGNKFLSFAAKSVTALMLASACTGCARGGFRIQIPIPVGIIIVENQQQEQSTNEAILAGIEAQSSRAELAKLGLDAGKFDQPAIQVAQANWSGAPFSVTKERDIEKAVSQLAEEDLTLSAHAEKRLTLSPAVKRTL